MRIFFLICILPLSLLSAATITDLGQGLCYLRVENPGTDFAALQSALSQPAPLVIDLRAAGARPADFPSRPGTRPGPAGAAAPLRILLVNPGTPAGLLRAFALPAPGWLVLGPAAPGLAVDAAVDTPLEADRRAVAALIAGAPPETLFSRPPEKKRYDEAALVRDYASQPAEAPGPSGPGGNDNTEPAAPAEAPPVDAVLQRARDIHRALLALKKIP
ncbi:MAG: hypothetical protein LBM92_03510 [Opitutaceae bacterium]|nr:hypothetical protein [Opitutaceae bacterium]